MKTFSIIDIPEFTKKEKIVVVGVIGKSPLRYPNKLSPLITSVKCDERGIECFWDERNSVLYLHATTYMDSDQLSKLVAELEDPSETLEKDLDTSHFLVAAGELAIESSRIFALVFHLSHIVILSSPSPVFDYTYLQIFKAIDAYRLELSGAASEALSASGAGGAWTAHGRVCCPRLLFHFRNAPRPLRRKPAALKKLQHSIEDQLYFVLRKTRLITNVCAKSLFAIPKNEEFVYMSAVEEEYRARDVSSLVEGLERRCGGGVRGGGATAAPGAGDAERPTFRQFLNSHIELAFGEGFDDNVGKYAMSTSFFELPSASSWRAAARGLAPLYLTGPAHVPRSPREARAPPADDERPAGEIRPIGEGRPTAEGRTPEELRSISEGRAGGDGRTTDVDGADEGALYEHLAIDIRFSKARCAKVLPIALATYMEGLPAHYSSQHHAHKLSAALSALRRGAGGARGPAAAAARRALLAAGAAARRLRRACDLPSLAGHPCVLPHHDESTAHSSGVRYVCACDCGRSKAAREDAYTLDAEIDFYENIDCNGCRQAQRIHFPVFEPSTNTYKEASVSSVAEEEQWSGSPPAPAAAAQHQQTPRESKDTEDNVAVVPKKEQTAGRTLARSVSSTEYLPGLLHLGSPGGLLPRRSAWSLLCVGGAALYSHAAGLPEHLQPGLLPHAQHLLLWDCPHPDRAPDRAQDRPNARGRKAPPTLKIFYGYEYECVRGHRHMWAGGGSGGAGGGGAVGGGGGAGAAPAAAWCPSRARCGAAALRRLHVVTPKSDARVVLTPKIQPVANGPIFIPQPESLGGVVLPPSTYWILRFPVTYCDERGPLPAPTQPDPRAGIVPPMFALSE